MNKSLEASLKKRLDEAKGVWPEQLLQLLWAYRTSHRTSIGHTPFSLTFESEVVLLVEAKVATHRLRTFIHEQNDEALNASLDLIDEK